MKVFDKTLSTLEHALDVRLQRQNVLASNVANVDTPHYVPKDVDFAKAMEQAAAKEQRKAETPAVPFIPPGRVPEGSIALGAPVPPAPIPLDAPRPPLPPLAPLPGMTTAEGTPLVVAEGARPGIDGNGVDLERTMISLAQNGLQYSAAAKSAGKKLALIRYVASDGAA